MYLCTVVTPALAEASEGQERGDECSEIESKTEKSVLSEYLEIDAMCVEVVLETLAVIAEPEILVPERSKAAACERAIEGEFPRGAPGFETRRGRRVAGVGRLLLPDGPEPIPDSLRGQRGGDEGCERLVGKRIRQGERQMSTERITKSPRKAPRE
jgi:hypothetical protein